jgi:AraC family transcriptional regulator
MQDRPSLLSDPGSAAASPPTQEEIRVRRFANITLRETRYAPGSILGKHAHRNCGFGVVLSGSYLEAYSSTTLGCGPHTVKFRPAAESHVTCFGPQGARCVTIDVDASWLERLMGSTGRALDRPSCRVGGVSVTFARLHREIVNPDQFTSLAVEASVLELFVAFARGGLTEPRKSPSWLPRAREVLEQRFSERVGLSSLAQALGIHPVHLARQFRRHYGVSVGEYVRRLRVDKAKALLALSRMPLPELALDLGFSSQSHFTHIFKRETGVSPGRYRSAEAMS